MTHALRCFNIGHCGVGVGARQRYSPDGKAPFISALSTSRGFRLWNSSAVKGALGTTMTLRPRSLRQCVRLGRVVAAVADGSDVKAAIQWPTVFWRHPFGLTQVFRGVHGL